jgi:uncharacterized membrane protein (DUF485 family)
VRRFGRFRGHLAAKYGFLQHHSSAGRGDAVSLTGERPPEITQYQQIQASPEFIELKRKLRNFIFPMSAAFLLWYLAFVLLATYAPEFMQTKVLGNINIGLIIGLSQFVTTFLITMLYVRYANRQLDPLSEKLRREIEEAGL